MNLIMHFYFLSLTVSCLPIAAAIPSRTFDNAAYEPSSIITRDVCIIGGGSSGTYAAIALRDQGKTVAVIEAQSVLGGHTITYTDPATNTKIDYGVVVFGNTSTVTSYFDRFDIPLTTGTGAVGSPNNYYVDFRTGKNVTDYVPADPTGAFGAYGAQLANYPFLNTPGWHLPDPVPADLLLPFGDFVDKYQLGDAVFIINQFAQGFGDVLTIPTLYILKYFGQGVLQGAQTGFLTTARHNNGELYEKARAELGGDVFFNSRVVATARTGKAVKIVVKTRQGIKLIVAKKLVISIPPLLSNLVGFNLSPTERHLLRQFRTGAYYTALLRNTGIPDDVSVTNIGADTPYNLPALPGVYFVSPTLVPDIKDIKFGGTKPLSDKAVKASILSQVQNLKNAGLPVTTPEFAAYESHTPYALRVSADAIAEGFYANLTALQGKRNTWWTGAAFDKHDSGDLWAFTAGLVERIVKEL